LADGFPSHFFIGPGKVLGEALLDASYGLFDFSHLQFSRLGKTYLNQN